MSTWIELELGVLRENIVALRRALSAGTEIVFVVKANAYGHGMAPVVRTAWESGVRRFAVAHLDEALALRALLPEAGLILLGVLDPRDVAAAAAAAVVPVVVDREHALALARAAAAAGVRLRGHAKIDTGMGRLGFVWNEAAAELAALAHEPGLAIEGLCSHFASSHGAGRAFTETQGERFHRVAEACSAAGLPRGFRHVSNSGGIVCGRAWDVDGVRPGILLYGYGTDAADAGDRAVHTRPFLHWKTRVVQVKKVPAGTPVSYDSTFVTRRTTWLATLDVGYADGYMRRLSNRGQMLIRGRRRPIAGRVTMNLTVVDLGPEADADVGDTATLIGTDGAEAIWADEVGGWCDTISYEILTGIRTEDRRVCAPPATPP